MLVGMADTFMVAALGEEAISGVTLINILEFFIMSLTAALSSGGGVVISQYLGAKMHDEAELAAGQSTLVTLLFSAGVTALALVFHEELLRLLYGSVAPGVMQAADTYLLIAACSVPTIAIHQSCSVMFRAVNAAKLSLAAVLTINICNILGNYLAVYVLHAGVSGVAWATVLARAAGNVLLLYFALRPGYGLHLSAATVCRWHAATIRKILQVAVPNAVENGLFAAGKVMMTAIVALFGTTQMAANAVANTFQITAIFVINAMNLGIVPVVGQCVGAGDYAQARYYIKKLLRISYIATAVLAALSCAAMLPALPYYNISRETAELTVLLVVMHNIAAFLLQPICFNLPNALRAAGDVRYTMYAGIGSMLIFRLGVAVALGIWLDWQIIGVWLAMAADWLARALLFVYRYRSGKWQQYRLV